VAAAVFVSTTDSWDWRMGCLVASFCRPDVDDVWVQEPALIEWRGGGSGAWEHYNAPAAALDEEAAGAVT
jgi:hypothetical protein